MLSASPHGVPHDLKFVLSHKQCPRLSKLTVVARRAVAFTASLTSTRCRALISHSHAVARFDGYVDAHRITVGRSTSSPALRMSRHSTRYRRDT